MKYTFTITKDGAAKPEKKAAMPYKKVLKSLTTSEPKWSGMIEYVNKKKKNVVHFIVNGRKYRTDSFII